MFLGTEPREIAPRNGELIEPRHAPPQEFIGIAFRYHGHLIAVKAQVAFGFHTTSRQHITADDSDLFRLRPKLFLAHDAIDRQPRNHTEIAWLSRFRSGQCNNLTHVDPSGPEESADHGHMLHVDRPHHISLIDRIDMVNLHPDVACRMRTLEQPDFSIFHLIQHTGGSVFQTQIDLSVGQLTEQRKTGLQILGLVFEHEVHVRSQRRRIETRNENRLWRILWIGHNPERTLNDHRP